MLLTLVVRSGGGHSALPMMFTGQSGRAPLLKRGYPLLSELTISKIGEHLPPYFAKSISNVGQQLCVNNYILAQASACTQIFATIRAKFDVGAGTHRAS